MDLTFPADVEQAARTAREFVESRAAAGLTGLASLVARSPLAHFAVLRELGRAPAPWAETFRAAGLQFHDVARLGVAGDAGLVGLALGDPRRRPTSETLGVGADPGPPPTLHGLAQLPGYLAPVDSILVAAAVAGERPDVGLFLVSSAAGDSASRGPLGIALNGTPARLLERGEAAWQLLLALRRRERLSQIALAVGAATRANEVALAVAREATAAKDPLALGQGVQFQVADDAIDLQVAETLALHSATLAEAGTLTEAELASTRFMVVEALERIARRAAHVAGLFSTPGATAQGVSSEEAAGFFVDLARRLGLEGGAVELDRREAALGVLQSL